MNGTLAYYFDHQIANIQCKTHNMLTCLNQYQKRHVFWASKSENSKYVNNDMDMCSVFLFFVQKFGYHYVGLIFV